MKRVKGFIERKSMLYKTNVEYGDYTMNHVLGCAHGCNYPCYAFLMARRFGKVKNYEEWIEPFLVRNTLELLDREIPKFKHLIKSVQLCFTTDPFMYQFDEIASMSLAAINKLNSSGIKCVVLTKGLLPTALGTLSPDNEYGITLISLDEIFRSSVEPGASNYTDRISSLKKLAKMGCNTWVSIEPYPTPNIIDQDLNSILESVDFVDKIIFGKLNYNKLVSGYTKKDEFYRSCVEQVISFCERKKIAYHIKDGTLKS